MTVNIVSIVCKNCNDTGSYAVVEQDREGENYLEQVECGCEFMRRHAIVDTSGEEE
jgi:RNase P subunit RPR2